MSDYKDFDDALDITYAGVLNGVVEPAVIFQQWFKKQRRQSQRTLTQPAVLRPQPAQNITIV